jgi:hypothetical protein
MLSLTGAYFSVAFVTVEAETMNSIAKIIFVRVNRITEEIGSNDINERQ